MHDRPSWVSQDVDLDKASAARCYDYYLGGAHNFAVDRELAHKVEAVAPNVRQLARNNRAFLRRAVRHCVDQGVRQFLDLGSGIPTVGNVHEIAHAVDPGIRVVYVDYEPVAVAHSRTILEGNDRADVVRADVADVDAVLGSPEVRRLLDLDEPVAVMMVALFHFIPDSWHPSKIVRRYFDRMAPGSRLGFSHATAEHCPALLDDVMRLYADSSNPLVSRTRAEVATLLEDFELVDPGIVHVPEWRPDSPEDRWRNPEQAVVYGAVGLKR